MRRPRLRVFKKGYDISVGHSILKTGRGIPVECGRGRTGDANDDSGVIPLDPNDPVSNSENDRLKSIKTRGRSDRLSREDRVYRDNYLVSTHGTCLEDKSLLIFSCFT